jgi:uncharacterized membrane protein
MTACNILDLVMVENGAIHITMLKTRIRFLEPFFELMLIKVIHIAFHPIILLLAKKIKKQKFGVMVSAIHGGFLSIGKTMILLLATLGKTSGKK